MNVALTYEDVMALSEDESTTTSDFSNFHRGSGFVREIGETTGTETRIKKLGKTLKQFAPQSKDSFYNAVV